MNRPGAGKRQKEIARKEKRERKEAERIRRKVDPSKPQGPPGEDPDIAGIVPGPQPPLDEFAGG